jgi:hypothetical protein
MLKNDLKLTSLEDAKRELLLLKEASNVKTKQWSLYKILVHCTQTIEYSMKGYPKLKPKIIQVTVGKIAVSKFLKQGYMKHSLTAPVLEAPDIPEGGNLDIVFQNLMDSIDDFVAYSTELKPHLLFGKLTKEEYDKYFAMHIADHLSELNY